MQWQRLRELRARARRAPVRRSAVLRRAALRRDLGAPRAVPARRRAASRPRSAACRRITSRELGQLWGNPLYDWDGAAARRTFDWWRARVRAQLERLDLLRLDHFRALAAYWAVPAGAAGCARRRLASARPGEELLQLLRDELGDLPLVAEDLGVITAEVVALRKTLRPARHARAAVRLRRRARQPAPAAHARARQRRLHRHARQRHHARLVSRASMRRRAQRVDFYLRAAPAAMPEALIRAALGSVAQLAVIPPQDLLGLGSEARLNTPGTATRQLAAGGCRPARSTRSWRSAMRASTAASAAPDRRARRFVTMRADAAVPAALCPRAVLACAARAAARSTPKLRRRQLSVVERAAAPAAICGSSTCEVRLHVQNPNDRALPVEGSPTPSRSTGQQFASGESAPASWCRHSARPSST